MAQEKLTVEKADKLVKQMLAIRARREARLRDLQKWLYPARGVFCNDSLDDGYGRFARDDRELLRFTHAATSAILRAASGMTNGMTPKNANWFIPDFAALKSDELMGMREWLDGVSERMQACLSDGGFYQAIQNFNIDLLWSGCGLLYCEKNREVPLFFEACQIGSFVVATDRYGALTCVARQIGFTAEELEREFGEKKLSKKAKDKLKLAPYDMVKVWHLARLAKKKGGKSGGALKRLAVESYWFEAEASEPKSERVFLRQGGYEEMPFFFTTWHEGVTPYGVGPGDGSLADVRQLDKLERDKLLGISKLTNPPLYCSAELKDNVGLGPGAINYLRERGAQIGPLYELGPVAQSLGNLREEIMEVRNRLEQSLFAAIFTSIPLEQRPRDMSATEFLERKREALQQLGPVISAYEPNVLTPLLHRVFLSLARAGELPNLPESLAGQELAIKMEFVSPLANALRQNSAEATRALFQEAAGMAQASQNPEVLDKVDLDQMLDELARGMGAPGSVIRSDEEVARIRQERLAAKQREEEMQAKMAEAKIGREQMGMIKDGAEAYQAAAGAEAGMAQMAGGMDALSSAPGSEASGPGGSDSAMAGLDLGALGKIMQNGGME